MWLRKRSSCCSTVFGLPFSSTKNHSGVWLCQTSVWPTMNMPRASPNSTNASAGPKLYWPGRGAIGCAFMTFSGVIELKCCSTIASDAASRPDCTKLPTATPTRNASAYASFKVSAGCAGTLAEAAASNTPAVSAARRRIVGLATMLHHVIDERADAVDADLDAVVGVQGERIRRHDARARREKRALREAVVDHEEPDELRGAALHHRERRRALERRGRVALDRETDRGVCRQRRARDQNAGPEREALIVGFRLRQVERVLAFDVARAHVVADRVADDLAAPVHGQHELGLRHAPLRIAPHAHGG